MKQNKICVELHSVRWAILHIILTALLVLGLCVPACAASVDEGEFGDGFTWCLDEEGIFTLSGEGKLPGFSSGERPWDTLTEQILTVVYNEGLTNTGEFYFQKCVNLSSVRFSETVAEISDCCFMNCDSLAVVELPEQLKRVGGVPLPLVTA